MCPTTTTILLSWLILQVIRSHGVNPSTDHLSAIDYFSTGQTNGAQISSNAQGCNAAKDEQEACEVEEDDSVGRRKRKQKHVKRDVKMKKKKSERGQLDVDGHGAAVFLHNKTAYRKLFDSRQY